jgi:hypothetical protein
MLSLAVKNMRNVNSSPLLLQDQSQCSEPEQGQGGNKRRALRPGAALTIPQSSYKIIYICKVLI